MSDIELIKKFVPEDKQQEAINKLEKGYPVQYIIGNVEFYNLTINVDERVLIPRFETEYLVDKTIKLIELLNMNPENILEIGTGSGCISIALKKRFNSRVDAIDISKDAIDVAKTNALNNDVDINFSITDIHDFKSDKKYDLIISNPPYVPYNSDVFNIDYEPKNAIYAEDGGIYFYKIILDKVKNNLNTDYLIAFEIGDKEGLMISKLIENILPNAYYKVETDYNNYDRYVFISNKNIVNI